MHTHIVDLLICPNSNNAAPDIECIESDVDGKRVVTGVIFFPSEKTAYPIEHGIGVMLSDEDTNAAHHQRLLNEIRDKVTQKSRSCIEATIDRLQNQEITDTGNWNREEMKYYDARNEIIESPNQSPMSINNIIPDWNRSFLREKYIFRHIYSKIKNDYLVEIGCGTAKTVAKMLDPERFDYNYIGIEVSWQRLLHARAITKSGNFLQASAMNIPLKEGIIDVALAFGAIHHLADQRLAVDECNRILSPGGIFAFHEPIRTKKILPEGSAARRIVEGITLEYEHSEHDDEIDYRDIREKLIENGFNIVREVYTSSFIEIVFSKFAGIAPKPLKKGIYRLKNSLDIFWNMSIGRLFPRIGPRGIILLARKR